MKNIELTTKRLIIKDIDMSYCLDMFNNWGCDDRVSEYMLWNKNNNIDEIKRIIEIWTENNNKDDYCQLVIVDKQTMQGIGTITCCFNNKHKFCSLAFCLGVDWWGCGIMIEALTEVMKYFYKNNNIHRFECEVLKDNNKCLKMLEKCGFEKEGVSKQKYFTKRNKWEDVIIYSKLFKDKMMS